MQWRPVTIPITRCLPCHGQGLLPVMRCAAMQGSAAEQLGWQSRWQQKASTCIYANHRWPLIIAVEERADGASRSGATAAECAFTNNEYRTRPGMRTARGSPLHGCMGQRECGTHARCPLPHVVCEPCCLAPPPRVATVGQSFLAAALSVSDVSATYALATCAASSAAPTHLPRRGAQRGTHSAKGGKRKWVGWKGGELR